MERRVLEGSGASPGQGAGAARVLGASGPSDAVVPPELREEERRRALDALERAGAQVSGLADRLRGEGREEDARLVETGALMAEDPELRAAVERATSAGATASAAILQSAESAARAIAAVSDEMLAARADDVRSLARRASALAVRTPDTAAPRNAAGTVLVASELGPADVLELDPGVGGIALAAGGVTSHAAIVARSLGVPMVTGAGDAVLELGDGDTVAIDGTAGTVVISPDREEFSRAAAAVAARRRAHRQAVASRGLASVTTDGRETRVLVNAAGPAEVRLGLEAGAAGIGLLRTEMAFLESTEWPSEAAHRRALEPILAELQTGATATVRLLDLGGDKTPPFLGSDPRRGIELLLAAGEALALQVRAILSCARDVELRLLIPMVRGVDDVRRVREVVVTELAALPGAAPPRIGAMVETSEAADGAAAIAAEADFISIGTNDLTASVLGTDRAASTAVAIHDPRLLRMLAGVALAAGTSGIPVEVCGEMAGDPRMVPLLVGFGIDELSVGAARVAPVRSWIRSLSYLDAVRLASLVLGVESADDISALVDPVAARLQLLEAGNAGGEGFDGGFRVAALGA